MARLIKKWPPAAACRAAEAEQRAVAGHRRQGCSDRLRAQIALQAPTIAGRILQRENASDATAAAVNGNFLVAVDPPGFPFTGGGQR